MKRSYETITSNDRLPGRTFKSFAVPLIRSGDQTIRMALLHESNQGWVLLGLNAIGQPCRGWRTCGDITSVQSKRVPPERLGHILTCLRVKRLYLNDGSPIRSILTQRPAPFEIRPVDGGMTLEQTLESIKRELAPPVPSEHRASAVPTFEQMRELEPGITATEYKRFCRECKRAAR